MLENLKGIYMVLTRQQSMSADNQQGTDPWVAWLAGIFDGEGSVGIYARKFKGRPYTNYTMRITITNTSIALLDKIKAILDHKGLSYYVKENERQNHKNWRPRWQMLFTGFSRTYLFLKLIRPYVVGKAREVDLALEWLESRMNTPTASTPYSTRDLEIVELLKQEKRNGHLRD